MNSLTPPELPGINGICLGRDAVSQEFMLEAAQWLPQPIEQVFAFFCNAMQLEQITPPWLNFKVLNPPAAGICQGTIIDYRLRLHGIPLRWRSRIWAWEPPNRFVDEQLRGPYRRWIHEHRFEPVAGGTLCRDVVRYAVPGGWLINRLFVARSLHRIFAYRQNALARRFAAEGPVANAS